MNRRVILIVVILMVLLVSVFIVHGRTPERTMLTATASYTLTPSVTWTPTPTIIRPTYDSAGLSPTAPVPFITQPTPLPMRVYPTLTLPAVQVTSSVVERVSMVLEPDVGCCYLLTDDELRDVALIVRRRLETAYVSDLNIVTVDGRIYLEMSDVTDMDYVLSVLEAQQGIVEIIDLNGITLVQRQALIGQQVLTTAYDRFNGDALVNPFTGAPFETALTISYPIGGYVNGMEGRWTIPMRLRYEDSEQLLAFTSANVGQLMGVVLDGVVISAPLIERPLVNFILISDVDGGFTDRQARLLSQTLPYGSLPFPLNIVEFSVIE